MKPRGLESTLTGKDVVIPCLVSVGVLKIPEEEMADIQYYGSLRLFSMQTLIHSKL